MGRSDSSDSATELRSKNLADLLGQSCRCERFLEEVCASIGRCLLHHCGSGIARHKEHSHVRPHAGKPLNEFATFHLRHDEIGEQKMDLRFSILAGQQRSAALPLAASKTR